MIAAADKAAARQRDFDCPSPEATRQLACRLGRMAPSGLVIALSGTLGSGKTVFVQGLAEGLDVAPNYVVTSPSFTLINEYPGRQPLYHADLYRLGPDADLETIGLLDLMGAAGVLAIEWAAAAQADLPEAYLAVHLEITGDLRRRITFTAYGLGPDNLLKKLADPGGDGPPHMD